MKRILVAVLLCLLLSFSVAGCGGNGDEASDEEYKMLLEGSDPSELDNIHYPKVENLKSVGKITKNLADHGMFFKAIKDVLGEPVAYNEKYNSYLDGAVLCYVNDGRVNNIVFTDKYTEGLFYGNKNLYVTVGTPIAEIAEKVNGESIYGSVEAGYIGYRTSEFYVFIYKDAISVWGYGYRKDDYFDEYLTTYLETRDLDTFVANSRKHWTGELIDEYDAEKKYAHIVYPSYGIELYIVDNNPKGIIFYKNAYMTDVRREFIKSGQVTLRADEDLIVKWEKDRIESESAVK